MANTYDLIIVGAGVAGSALAYAAGSQGRRVLLLERDLSEPDRIVGELMQPAGITKLKALGLEDCLDGIDGIDVFGYAVVTAENVRHTLPYPTFIDSKDPSKKIIGRSMHYGRFVMNLRRKASSLPTVTLLKGTGSGLIEDGESGVVKGVIYKETPQAPAQEAFASLTVVADGCFSNLRKKFGVDSTVTVTGSNFVGVILSDCKLPFPNFGHVFLAKPGPVLSYQIGSNEIRVLVDVPSPLPSNLSQYLLETTAPQLPDELRDAFIRVVTSPNKADRPRTMPNNILHPSYELYHAQQHMKPGCLLLGDAWNMRHPLTGGGMTVALSDVVILSGLLSNVSDLSNRQQLARVSAQFARQRQPLAATVNILATALYKLFSALDDPSLPVMRSACMDYFQAGGWNVTQTMSLLSGMLPKPHALIFHFFRVAVWGAWKALRPFPTPGKLWNCYKVLSAASWIVIPLMKGERVFSSFATLLSVVFYRRTPKGVTVKHPVAASSSSTET